ncbi:MAG TPA: isoprenylcysteine carboxylmethyltransferase family protein [Terriglobales bacterium]|nr:isoprenylcysteine carboxylmethyltransferase family protein [Terriglobales bacterium]
MLCWLVFAGVFFLRKKPKTGRTQKRDRSSLIGLFIQIIGFFIVWVMRRPIPSDLLPFGKAVETILAIITVGFSVSSAWMVSAAVLVLNRQWSLGAQLIEGHRLVTTGPYKLVRHPIYSGMLGLMLATALALSRWIAIIPATILFVAGAVIRISSEEKLLRQSFGQEFEDYVRKVPMLIPRCFLRKSSAS